MNNSTIITINKDGIIQSVDKNCCLLFGYDLEEFIGNSVKLIIPSPYHEQHDAYLENYLKTGQERIIGKSRLVEGKHKDGSIFPIRLSVSKIGEGDDIVFIGLIDKVDDETASITINASGTIMSTNHNVSKIFGYSSKELIGQNISKLVAGAHKEKHDGYIKRFLNRGNGPSDVVGHLRNLVAQGKNGQTFPISILVESLVVGTTKLFRAIIDKVDMETVFTLDSEGVVTSCNRYVQPLFGYSNSDIIGKSISSIIPLVFFPNSRENSEEVLDIDDDSISMEPEKKKRKTARVSFTSGTFQTEVSHKDGSHFPAIFEVFPFNHPDKGTQYSVQSKRADLDNIMDETDGKLIGNYQIGRTIGRGAFGKVKIAIHKDTQQKVAVKVLQKEAMSEDTMKRTWMEIEILKKLHHPHISTLYDIFESDENIYIFIELSEKTLQSAILDKKRFTEEQAKKYFVEILSGVQHCHAVRVVHRDLKGDNILIDSNGSCKIVDFGLSNYIRDGQLRTTFCGTPAFAAPEMILGKRYTGPEVDIWSLGVILFFMLTGHYPFDKVEDIIIGDYKIPDHISSACCDLLIRILEVQVKDRITLPEICEHRWLSAEYEVHTEKLTAMMAADVEKEEDESTPQEKEEEDALESEKQ